MTKDEAQHSRWTFYEAVKVAASNPTDLLGPLITNLSMTTGFDKK
jgi:hypothetical protein